MNSREIVSLNVADECNFHCPGCHWFSEDVVVKEPQPVESYLRFFCRLGPIDRVQFTGGEPTLWPGLVETINNAAETVGIFAIFTNGHNIKMLEGIKRKNIYIRVTLHPETDLDKTAEVVHLALNRSWRIKVYSFGKPDLGMVVPSEIIGIPVYHQKDQIKLGKSKYSGLLGKEVLCSPRMIYIGTDGVGYCCENGLRNKDPRFTYNFNLTSGKIYTPPRRCIVQVSCLGNFETEQYVELIS